MWIPIPKQLAGTSDREGVMPRREGRKDAGDPRADILIGQPR